MSKRILLMTLVACLLFTVVVHADECEHLYKATEYLGGGYISVDANYHKLRQNWRQICVNCGDEASTYYEYSPDVHIFVQEQEWHVEGELVHHYADSCKYCDYTKYRTESCSGANCIKQAIKWRLSR